MSQAAHSPRGALLCSAGWHPMWRMRRSWKNTRQVTGTCTHVKACLCTRRLCSSTSFLGRWNVWLCVEACPSTKYVPTRNIKTSQTGEIDIMPPELIPQASELFSVLHQFYRRFVTADFISLSSCDVYHRMMLTSLEHSCLSQIRIYTLYNGQCGFDVCTPRPPDPARCYQECSFFKRA